ncbi:MAG: hypothetical protein QM758_23625 [Armatimonas sp.]
MNTNPIPLLALTLVLERRANPGADWEENACPEASHGKACGETSN